VNRSTKRPSILRRLLNGTFNKGLGNGLQLTHQAPLLPQDSSNQLGSAVSSLELNVFERIAEYQAVLEHHAQLSTRRQHTSDIYIGLNTFFLTAMGWLLLQSHLDTWWAFAMVSALTVVILPINVTWRAALIRYAKSLSRRYDYLREIEQEFRERRGTTANQPEIGLFLRLKETGLYREGNSQLEIRLATYFICLYPIVSVVVGILVYLIEQHFIQPLNIV